MKTLADQSQADEVLQLDTRPAISIRTHIGSTVFNLVGLYLNDQNNANRRNQMNALRPHLDTMLGEPTMLGGDFNTMHENARTSRLLQAYLVQKLLGKITLANNTLPRLFEMAEGTSLHALQAQGFVDADANHAPTAPSRMPLFQLDRFMYRNLETAGLTAGNVRHTNKPKLSDHKMIETTVQEK